MNVLLHFTLRALGGDDVVDLTLGDIELDGDVDDFFTGLAGLTHIPMGDRLDVQFSLGYEALHFLSGSIYDHASTVCALMAI